MCAKIEGEMTMFGLICAYMLVGVLSLHCQPHLVARGSMADTCLSVLKMAMTWPWWIGRDA